MEKAELQVSKKYQQIVATAEELFLKHGFKRVSIEEICQKAGELHDLYRHTLQIKCISCGISWDYWIEDAYQKTP